MSEKVGCKGSANACACPETQKRVLDRTRTRILIPIHRTPPNKLQTLPFVKEHVTTANLELGELLIGHWHREDILNVNSSIKDVFRAEIWAQWSRTINCESLARNDFSLFTNFADLPVRREVRFGLRAAGPHFHTDPIFLRCP